jgi:hypothetical protein
MKKVSLIIGLFTLVMASASFAAPTVSTSTIDENPVITSIDGTGSQDSGGNRKVDFTGNLTVKTATVHIGDIDGTGSQDSGGNRKVD